MSKDKKREEQNYQYDVCLSFAGEDRKYVEEVADGLTDKGVRVFYDKYEQIELWGKDLYTHLDDIYQNSAKYCVIFVSKHYAEKLWSNHERQSAQARAFKENKEYILPARFDDTIIPGLRDTIGYVNLRKNPPFELVKLILKKVGEPERALFLPPNPDLLFRRLGAKKKSEIEEVDAQSNAFLNVLKRMSLDERNVITKIFSLSCPAELPEYVHVDWDLLRRHVGFPFSKIKRLLSALRSLGFYCSIRDVNEEDDEHLGKSQMVYLEWQYLGMKHGGNGTMVAHQMIKGVTEGFCEEHVEEMLQRLDFSRLSSVTTAEHKH